MASLFNFVGRSSLDGRRGGEGERERFFPFVSGAFAGEAAELFSFGKVELFFFFGLRLVSTTLMSGFFFLLSALLMPLPLDSDDDGGGGEIIFIGLLTFFGLLGSDFLGLFVGVLIFSLTESRSLLLSALEADFLLVESEARLSLSFSFSFSFMGGEDFLLLLSFSASFDGEILRSFSFSLTLPRFLFSPLSVLRTRFTGRLSTLLERLMSLSLMSPSLSSSPTVVKRLFGL